MSAARCMAATSPTAPPTEFGFDYLRDNGMATRKEDQVQRDHWFCIVDEIDSILVDEARTPLIISGPAPIERAAVHAPQAQHRSPSTIRSASATRSSPGGQRLDFEKPGLSDDDRQLAAHKMPEGQDGPPEEQAVLLRLMGSPEWRKLLDKTETDLNSDLNNKDELYRSGGLLFVIDERSTRPTSPRSAAATPPDNPDAFIAARSRGRILPAQHDPKFTPRARARRRSSPRRIATPRSPEEIHAISQLRAYAVQARRRVRRLARRQGR